MPEPVYIMCCDSVSQDKVSNLVSMFQIIEQVTVVSQPDGNGESNVNVHGGRHGFQAVAVWRKESGDSGHEYVHEFLVGDRPTGAVPFTFTKNLRRFLLNSEGFPVPRESSMVFITSRVRRKDADEWRSQTYPIFFEIIHESAEPMEHPAPSPP